MTGIDITPHVMDIRIDVDRDAILELAAGETITIAGPFDAELPEEALRILR